ncbi:3-oxoacyl-(acyl carrier protein) synthase I, partial [mine drainage metagenome]
ALPQDFLYASTHNPFSLGDFVRRSLALAGPAAVVSTACSSSAKVFGSAARLIETGVIDAAVVGGVDSLCLTTLYGFHALQLVARAPCRPFDMARDGISIGEAAAFALLEPLGSDRPPAPCGSPASGSRAMPITCPRLTRRDSGRARQCWPHWPRRAGAP